MTSPLGHFDSEDARSGIIRQKGTSMGMTALSSSLQMRMVKKANNLESLSDLESTCREEG